MANNENVSTTETTKKSSKKGLIIGIALAFFIGMMVGASGKDSTETNSSNSNASESTQEVKDQPKTAEAPKTWQKVIEFSGENNKRSDVFTLTGGKTKMTYTVTEGAYVSIYVMDEGESLEKSGGFPEITMADKSGETNLMKSAGNYYLDVNGGNGSWTVVIEEEK